MGWIVHAAVVRYRQEMGSYHAREWFCFARRIGLEVIVTEMGPTMPAVLIDGKLLIDKRLPECKQIEYAWHEIAHYLLHGGSIGFWLSRPGGDSYVRKLERQCWEFVRHFPIWD